MSNPEDYQFIEKIRCKINGVPTYFDVIEVDEIKREDIWYILSSKVSSGYIHPLTGQEFDWVQPLKFIQNVVTNEDVKNLDMGKNYVLILLGRDPKEEIVDHFNSSITKYLDSQKG